MSQHTAVLDSLHEMSSCNTGDVATKARGLLHHFKKRETVILLSMALNVFLILEQLNRSLQAKSATMSGMIKAVNVVKTELETKRSSSAFEELWKSSSEISNKLDLEAAEVPRKRRPPSKLCGSSEAYNPSNVEEQMRAIYYQLIDTTTAQLSQRFDPTSRGIATYRKLESFVIDGKVDADIVHTYPELDGTLSTQLAMFRSQWTYTTVSGAVDAMQAMSEDVRRLFLQVERLLRLLLICPVSSCEAERSFSSQRRLKTWLRNNMTQSRLNSIAVCNVHQNLLDNINLEQLIGC